MSCRISAPSAMISESTRPSDQPVAAPAVRDGQIPGVIPALVVPSQHPQRPVIVSITDYVIDILTAVRSSRPSSALRTAFIPAGTNASRPFGCNDESAGKREAGGKAITTMLADPTAVQEVIDGFARHLRPGATLIEASTKGRGHG
jgi:hypothetical protein